MTKTIPAALVLLMAVTLSVCAADNPVRSVASVPVSVAAQPESATAAVRMIARTAVKAPLFLLIYVIIPSPFGLFVSVRLPIVWPKGLKPT